MCLTDVQPYDSDILHLINLTEGVSYAAMLKDLEKRIKPEELGVAFQGIRETRFKDLLVELKCFKDRGWLDAAFKDVIGASGSVRHFIPRIEVEIADINPSTDSEE